MQSVQDTTVEHYLEAAKQIADHAVIGSGPLGFHTDAGESGLELSALDRINQLYATKGFRVVSGEGGRPFGFERYAKAFYVAWHYKHRAALGDPTATVRGLAAKEGITGRFADHIWDVVNRTGTGYPSADMIAAWQQFAAPTADAKASIAKARERGRRPDQEAGDLAQLVLRARRPGRRRRRRRDAAAVRRHDAGRQDDAHLQLRAEPALRPAGARRAAPDRAVRSAPARGRCT